MVKEIFQISEARVRKFFQGLVNCLATPYLLDFPCCTTWHPREAAHMSLGMALDAPPPGPSHSIGSKPFIGVVDVYAVNNPGISLSTTDHCWLCTTSLYAKSQVTKTFQATHRRNILASLCRQSVCPTVGSTESTNKCLSLPLGPSFPNTPVSQFLPQILGV